MIAIIGVLICLALAFACDANYNRAYYPKQIDPALSTLVPFYIVLGYIFAALGGSFMFTSLKSKQGRISTLMIPALASEKLISRMGIYVVIFPVFYILAVCIAEFARCSYILTTDPVLPVTPVYAIFSNPEALAYFTPSKYPFLVPCLIITGVFTVQSFFILGSILWPKLSYPKTFAMLFILFFTYSISVYLVGENLSRGLTYPRGPMKIVNEYIPYIILAFEFIVIIFNWTMAWWRLKETDVITTKR